MKQWTALILIENTKQLNQSLIMFLIFVSVRLQPLAVPLSTYSYNSITGLKGESVGF